MTHPVPQQILDTRNYRSSWRLTFHFDGERVHLVRRERVRKVAPATIPDPPTAGKNSGAWLELVDDAGRRLFHRLLNDPLRTRARHHSPDGHIELHVRAPEPGRFVVLVPDIPEAADAVLYASPADHQRMLEPAREIGRYRLHDPKPGDGEAV